jgi:hypothetical protein
LVTGQVGGYGKPNSSAGRLWTMIIAAFDPAAATAPATCGCFVQTSPAAQASSSEEVEAGS